MTSPKLPVRLYEWIRSGMASATDDAKTLPWCERVYYVLQADHEARLASLEAEVERLKPNAQRYEWFKRTYSASFLDEVTGRDGVSWAACWELRVYLPTSSEAELDAAIDAALATGKEA